MGHWYSIDKNKNRPPPYGWIQWKGTDVCMDVHCSCGELLHVDGSFLYHVKCAACGQVYEVSGYVDLHPVLEDPNMNPKVAT